jgi:hypothetical protein
VSCETATAQALAALPRRRRRRPGVVARVVGVLAGRVAHL